MGNKKKMNQDVGEILRTAVESFKVTREEMDRDGVRKTLGDMLKRQKKDTKVKRKWKQIEKGVALIILAAAAGYASNTLFISKAEAKCSEAESRFRESQTQYDEVKAMVDTQEETKARIQKLEANIERAKKRYPNYRTENEILLVLNELFAPKGVSVSAISVTPSRGVSKSEIGAAISQKGLEEQIEDTDYFLVSAADGEDASDAASAASTTDSEDAAPKDTDFDVTEVNFSVSGIDKDTATGLAETIYSSERILVPKELSVRPGGEEDEYAFQGTLLFYSYRVDETESLV